jgi:hypothetical protein
MLFCERHIDEPDRSQAGTDVTNQLDKLAQRMAENRVVAGVHYPEDIDKGKAWDRARAACWSIERRRELLRSIGSSPGAE